MSDQFNQPLKDKKEIASHPDNKIDQDFKGYPNGPAKDETIRPKTPEQHKTADTEERDGEKKLIRPEDRKSLDEQDSDGSANAFEGK